MRILILLSYIGCTQHVHTKDINKVNVGMSYDTTTRILGEPNKVVNNSIRVYQGTETAYNHEVLLYRSHSNASESLRDCYLIFTDKVLREVNCF